MDGPVQEKAVCFVCCSKFWTWDQEKLSWMGWTWKVFVSLKQGLFFCIQYTRRYYKINLLRPISIHSGQKYNASDVTPMRICTNLYALLKRSSQSTAILSYMQYFVYCWCSRQRVLLFSMEIKYLRVIPLRVGKIPLFNPLTAQYVIFYT